MHAALETVRDCLIGTPFEGDLYLVGGAVRDELLGIGHSDDIDLVTTQPASDLVRHLWQSGICDFHPVEFARFGTAMVSVGGHKIEVVQTRRESYSARSRKPDVQPGTLREDAERRDFTVNTLMRSLADGSLIDPLGCGETDLRARVLRTPREPRKTFHDDPLRMLRAVRFRHRLGFSYAPDLEEAIRKSATRLQIISAERIRDEFCKMLLHPTASLALEDLRSLDLLPQFLPEFLALKGCEQGKWHFEDAWDHTRRVVANVHLVTEDAPADLVTLLSALFHDVAKPQTRSEPIPGEVHFYRHEHEGAQIARECLTRLKVPGEAVERVAALVENHMRLSNANPMSRAAIRRLIRDMGEALEPLLNLCDADRRAHRDGGPLTELRAEILRVREETPAGSLESPLSGEEIMRLLALAPGPEVGKWKARVLEAVLQGEITDSASAAAWLLTESKKAN